MGVDDVVKPFYCGDDKTFLFKLIKSIGAFRVVGNDTDITISKGQYVEAVYDAGRLLFTRRPIPVPPSYEKVWDVMLKADTFDEQVVAVMRIFGVVDPKPTPKVEDDAEHEDSSG